MNAGRPAHNLYLDLIPIPFVAPHRLMPSLATAPASSALRLRFGGVAFEVLGEGWAPSETYRRLCEPGYDAALPLVRTSLRWDPSLRASPPGREIRWVRGGDRARIVASGFEAQIVRTAPRLFVASARLRPGGAACSTLLGALGSYVLAQCEGLILHAAAVEFEGGALLFIGPSGAGKTTAAGLVRGGRWFAFDRVAIARLGGRWEAFALPGGSDLDHPLSASERRGLPLRGILRVKQGRGGSRILPLSEPSALLRLRESAMAPSSDPAAEATLLGSLHRLATEVPMALAETTLGQPLSDALRTWLGAASEVPR
ncbi:MAG: hypothetical protein OEY14_13740 [Myxococcales bacterium]|nr:hypothetical protein [Myxococcales bacterium]